MKALVASVAITLAFASAAHAQTDGVERLGIMVELARISSPGGEERTVFGGADPTVPGRTAHHGYSLLPGSCSWSVSRAVEPNAELGWAVELTPVRVVGDAVTFRVAWTRTRDEGKATAQPRNDRELTLRPGESVPLDFAFRPCANSPDAIGASLRATVVQYPDPDYDRRLIGLDLWLVEKLQDGTERSQPLSLRGLYHRPVPFYFDSITEGPLVLDIFGELTVNSADRTSDVKIMTRSRIFDPNQRPGRPFPRETTASIRLLPNEVGSVQLPPVTDAGALASRALSLRIRVRQLR